MVIDSKYKRRIDGSVYQTKEVFLALKLGFSMSQREGDRNADVLRGYVIFNTSFPQ